MQLGWRTITTGFFVSTLWLSVAFIVAYPDYVLELRVPELAYGFVNGEREEILWLPFLILVDFFISLLLNHYRPTKNGMVTIVACSIGYFILAAALSRNSVSGGWPLYVCFVLAIGLLFAIRFVSFLSPVDGKETIDMTPVGETETL